MVLVPAGLVLGRLGHAVAAGVMVALCHVGLARESVVDGAVERAMVETALRSDPGITAFLDRRYALNRVHFLYREGRDLGWFPPDEEWQNDNRPARSDHYFARVRVSRDEAARGVLRYRVESLPDKSKYEVCYCPLHETDRSCTSGRVCHELSIGVTEGSGLLHVVAPADTPYGVWYHIDDFEPQRVELSVSDGNNKTYREVLVGPSEKVPDCSDYPQLDRDRYACLFQGEMTPPAPVRNVALLAALPNKLVQPKANYELTFAEEFAGTTGRRPAGLCKGGLSDLDGNKWNFDDNWCASIDAADVPCENMKAGHYEMSFTEQCGSGIDTRGKFSYKYGYLETKYTVELADSFPQNMAFVIGDHTKALKYTAAKYNVPMRNYEEMATNLPIEINLFEYFPERKRELTNWFYNYHPYIRYPHTEPRYGSTWTRFCEDSGQGLRQLNFFTVAQCGDRDSLTVTKGLEWTPAGYRMLVKIEDLHQDFIVVRKESMHIGRRVALSNSTPATYNGGVTNYLGSEREAYFKLLNAGDADSILMQFAVAHSPLEVWMDAWRGFGNNDDSSNNVTTVRMKVDYVRVFQPRDRYASMEPVYQ